MSGGTHSQGAYGQILIEPGAAAHTFDGNSLMIEFLSETMSEHGRLLGSQGIGRGTLQMEAARIRKGIGFTYGELVMYLSPNDVARLAETVLGLTESPSGTFTQSDSLPYFGMLINTDYYTFQFKDCMMTDWEIVGRAPQFGEDGEPEMIILKIGIRGSAVTPGTAWPVSPPSLGTAAIDRPYVFSDSDGQVTLNGTVRPIQAFRFKVDRGLYTKYANSLEAHSQRPTTRNNQLMVQLPWNSANLDLYNQAEGGAAAIIKFSQLSNVYSTSLNLGRFHVPNNTPVIRGKGEVPLNIAGFVTGTGATPDVQIVNDITP
jgi:hypothetical protein